MGVLDDVRHEAFAQAVARGARLRTAAREAGYKSDGGKGRFAKSRRIAARVAEIQAAAKWGEGADLDALMLEMIRLAGLGAQLGTAAGLLAAKTLLAEAAKLKQVPKPWKPPAFRERELTDQEWINKWAHPDSPQRTEPPPEGGWVLSPEGIESLRPR